MLPYLTLALVYEALDATTKNSFRQASKYFRIASGTKYIVDDNVGEPCARLRKLRVFYDDFQRLDETVKQELNNDIQIKMDNLMSYLVTAMTTKNEDVLHQISDLFQRDTTLWEFDHDNFTKALYYLYIQVMWIIDQIRWFEDDALYIKDITYSVKNNNCDGFYDLCAKILVCSDYEVTTRVFAPCACYGFQPDIKVNKLSRDAPYLKIYKPKNDYNSLDNWYIYFKA
jgi:hypothetical protein